MLVALIGKGKCSRGSAAARDLEGLLCLVWMSKDPSCCESLVLKKCGIMGVVLLLDECRHQISAGFVVSPIFVSL